MRNFSGNCVIIASNISQLRRVQTKHVMLPMPDPVIYGNFIRGRARAQRQHFAKLLCTVLTSLRRSPLSCVCSEVRLIVNPESGG